MRGLRYQTRGRPKLTRGANPKQRIAVEKLVALTRGIFAVAPVLTTLVVFVEAQQEFSDEIGDKLEGMGLAEEFLQQLQADHAMWYQRLSHYAAWLSHAVEGNASFWVDDEGNVVSENSPDASLEIPAADFLDLYVAQPLLYGSAYTIPSAQAREDKSGGGYSRFPDIGTGFSLVNQINAVGNVFDDASLLEKRFGLWLEIAAQVKQTEWAQDYAEDLDTLRDYASKALDSTSDFIDEVIERAMGIGIPALFLGVVVYAFATSRSK